MLKKLFKIVSLCLCMCLFGILSTKIIYATDYTDSNADDNAYTNNNGTVIFPKGCRSRWSGFLIYIVDGNSKLKSEVKVVTSFSSQPSYGDPVIETRLGGGSVNLDTAYIYKGAVWGYAPFDDNGNACGGAIRDWMLTKNAGIGYNLYTVIEYYFSGENRDIVRQFVENDWYLIVEPFFWFMYYDGHEASGFYICDTAKGIAEIENYINTVRGVVGNEALYGPSNFRRYTNNNFPNCCRFLASQFGIPVIYEGGSVKSGLLTNQEIIQNGYGIMSFWAGELPVKDTEPEEDGEWEYSEERVIVSGNSRETSKNGLYYIMNYSENPDYDISVGILQGERVKNYYEASVAFFDDAIGTLGIIERTITRRETAIYTYRWPNMITVQTGSKWVEVWEECSACNGTGGTESGYKYERKQCNDCGIIVRTSEWGIKCSECNGSGNVLADSQNVKVCVHCRGVGKFYGGGYYFCNICKEKNPVFNERKCTNSECDNGWYIEPAHEEICEECNGTGEVGARHFQCDAWGCEDGIVKVPGGKSICARCKGSGTEIYHNDLCSGSTTSYVWPWSEDCAECEGGRIYTTSIEEINCGKCDGEGLICKYCYSKEYTVLSANYSVTACSVCGYNEAKGYKGMVDNGYYVPVYSEVQDTTTPFITKEEVVEVIAKLKYQYIDNISVYRLRSFEVMNDALESGRFYYNNGMQEVSADICIYIGDNEAYGVAQLANQMNTKGITKDSGVHYIFANLEDMYIECESEAEYRSRIETDKEAAASYIYENSWSRNDELAVYIEGYSYDFIEDDIVDGCIIEEYAYHSSAADSIYAYEAQPKSIYEFNSLRTVIGSSEEAVREDEKGSYTTGIIAEYELLAGSGTDSKTLLSGKSHFTIGDSIYEHVIKPEGYGANHNGRDPDDGYNIIVKSRINPYIIITDNKMTEQTEPSAQLVDVLPDAKYHILPDTRYYIQLSKDISEDKYAGAKFIKFPFSVYYEGTYYETLENGYTEWIEVKMPEDILAAWDEGADTAQYESNNHWQVMPVYIPSWAEETDSTVGSDRIYLKIIDKSGNEIECEINAQVSGIIYGFTITGISDISQYYAFDINRDVFDIDFPAVTEKLEWIAGGKNRFGTEYYRYLLDGSITDKVKESSTLPIRRGSGDGTGYTKSGNGEVSKGTAFNYIVRTISGLNGENDYIEIIPRFKYVMPDGSVVEDEDLMIIYSVAEDSYIVAGSDNEKVLFKNILENSEEKYSRFGDMLAPCIGDIRFKDAFYDASDVTQYHFGDWVTYTANSINDRYFTNLPGYILIPSKLRLLCGEYEQLGINMANEKANIIGLYDLNMDGVADSGYDETSFRNSMQMWFGAYKVWDEFYCVDKSANPDFFKEGEVLQLDTDERILRGGKLVIGFEITAYKNGRAHLTYGDMWQTEGQRRYTIKEYIPDVTKDGIADINFPYDKIIYDNLIIDYGDVAIVDTTKRLSDNWGTGIFIID